jgi:hypothetical protein
MPSGPLSAGSETTPTVPSRERDDAWDRATDNNNDIGV